MTKKDIYSWNAMLSAHAKLRLVEDLCALFDQMPYRDSVSYNTMIASLTNKGRSVKALRALAWMKEERIEPTEYTYVSALQACSHLLDFRHGRQIHGRVIVGDSMQNVYVCHSLSDTYAPCGDIGRARWLFDQMVDKNVVSWNLMISVYVKKGNPDECIYLFDKMQLSGFKPDQITVSNVLNAYFQRGCVDDAQKMFGKITKRDEICWTPMIVGYAQNGREEDALMLFCDMVHENVRPDSFTISSVVSSCAKLASLYHSQVVHGKAFL